MNFMLSCMSKFLKKIVKHKEYKQGMSSLILISVHTMLELKMTGNSLKGSRPLLSFDKVRTQLLPAVCFRRHDIQFVFEEP